MPRQPWQSFTGIESTRFVHAAQHVAPGDLCNMSAHLRSERMAACEGHDPIRVCTAYAQDELVYQGGRMVLMPERDAYAAVPRERKVNKFGQAYRRDASFWLHRTLADITVGAAIHLYNAHGWTTVLYDGLRTVDGAYRLYLLAQDSDMDSGLLSLPGKSAHNKGMAVDSMMINRSMVEIDMGAHFDHLDMDINSRTYGGKAVSPQAQAHRLFREAAFLRSAFAQGLLIAPLRNEFWDDRLPENREDLWRVLDSAARCIGLPLLSADDEAMRRNDRKAFAEKYESWDYATFLARWQAFFAGHEELLRGAIGAVMPPLKEKPEFYHGNYHPIYDESLRASGKHLTDF